MLKLLLDILRLLLLAKLYRSSIRPPSRKDTDCPEAVLF